MSSFSAVVCQCMDVHYLAAPKKNSRMSCGVEADEIRILPSNLPRGLVGLGRPVTRNCRCRTVHDSDCQRHGPRTNPEGERSARCDAVERSRLSDP